MVKRPLKDIRPIGPLVGDEDSSTHEQRSVSVENLPAEEQRDGVTENLVEQAENWFEGITQEGMKRKMMVNYLDGITDDDVSNERIRSMVDEAGFK